MKLTIEDGRDHFYTFDTNRILLLTATDEEQINQVEFSTEENGETVSWTSDVLTGEDGIKYVQVPNEFLNGNYSRLVCYYVALDSKGEFTRQKEVFRIRARQEPEDYFLTYSERVTFASIKALTEQYKVNASNSADLARRYADESEDVNVETGTYSSRHWSAKSEKKFQEIKDYVGSTSDPKSALGSIESARASAVSDVNKQKTDSIEAVGTYTSNTAIPSVSQYVESTAKPALKAYGEQQVNSYVNGTSKPELDRYVNNEKKQVLDNYTAEKKSELDNYTETDKKQVLDSYTENEKKAELDSHTEGLKEQLNAHTVAKTGELNEYTTGLKSELDGYTTAKEQDISEFTEQKKAEVQGVYQADLNELKGDIGDLKSAINKTVLDKMELVTTVDWHNSNADTTGYAMQADGTVVENSSRFYSDFIPVNEGDTVYQFYFSGNTRLDQYRRNICCFDTNKQVVSGGNNSNTVNGFNVPSGVSYVRITSDLNSRSNIVFTVNEIPSKRPTAFFEPHYIIKNDFLTEGTIKKINDGLDFSKLSCSVPKQALRMTVGIAERWYFQNAGSPTYEFITISAGDDYTKRENECVFFKNTSPLNSDIYFKWSQYNNMLNIIETQGGDAQYGWPRHIIAENLSNCSCMIIGDSTVVNNGMTKKMLSYFSDAGKTITLIGTLGSNGNFNEGRAGWKATDYLTNRSYGGVVNPFYNPSTGTFDFSYYMANQGYSAPDFVVLQLGINDLYYSYSNAIESTWLAIQTMIDSIINYDTSIKILLNLPTPPNADQSKLSNTRFLYQNAVVRYARYAMDQAKALYGETKVRPTYCHLILDPATDIMDDVHPTNAGYEKMAMEVINQINCWQNGA